VIQSNLLSSGVEDRFVNQIFDEGDFDRMKKLEKCGQIQILPENFVHEIEEVKNEV
jgi:hypothetical protein